MGLFLSFYRVITPRSALVRFAGLLRHVCPVANWSALLVGSRCRLVPLPVCHVTGLPALSVGPVTGLPALLDCPRCCRGAMHCASTMPRNNVANVITVPTQQRCHATTVPCDHGSNATTMSRDNNPTRPRGNTCNRVNCENNGNGSKYNHRGTGAIQMAPGLHGCFIQQPINPLADVAVGLLQR